MLETDLQICRYVLVMCVSVVVLTDSICVCVRAMLETDLQICRYVLVMCVSVVVLTDSICVC